MKKKYTAKTHVAINVTKGGKTVHVAFKPVTGGSSVFYTEDEGLAKALESHYRFGSLFRLEAQPAPVKEAKPVKKAEAKAAEPEKPKAIEKTFASYDDAKDWLCQRYGLSRTKLRSITAIEAAAKANSVVLTIDKG